MPGDWLNTTQTKIGTLTIGKCGELYWARLDHRSRVTCNHYAFTSAHSCMFLDIQHCWTGYSVWTLKDLAWAQGRGHLQNKWSSILKDEKPRMGVYQAIDTCYAKLFPSTCTICKLSSSSDTSRYPPADSDHVPFHATNSLYILCQGIVSLMHTHLHQQMQRAGAL